MAPQHHALELRVALMISREAARVVIRWTSVSSRIIAAIIKTKHTKGVRLRTRFYSRLAHTLLEKGENEVTITRR